MARVPAGMRVWGGGWGPGGGGGGGGCSGGGGQQGACRPWMRWGVLCIALWYACCVSRWFAPEVADGAGFGGMQLQQCRRVDLEHPQLRLDLPGEPESACDRPAPSAQPAARRCVVPWVCGFEAEDTAADARRPCTAPPALHAKRSWRSQGFGTGCAPPRVRQLGGRVRKRP